MPTMITRIFTLALALVICVTHSLALQHQLFGEVKVQTDAQPIEVMTLTSFTFVYTNETTVSSLEVCTNETDVYDGTPFLTYSHPGEDETEVKGTMDETTNCAIFDITTEILLAPETLTTYVLYFPIEPNEDESIMKTGTATFTYSADGAVLTCSDGAKLLTRMSWIDGVEKTFDDTCLNDATTLPNVCYLDGNKSTTDICFTTADSDPENLKICRRGGLDTPAGPATSYTVKYLAYDPLTASSTRISIESVTANFELTIWSTPDTPAVFSCTANPCDVSSAIPTPSNVNYDMCVFEVGTSTSGSTSIQDVDLLAYFINDDKKFTEFGFLNLNSDPAYYTASLMDYRSESEVGNITSVNINCNGVDPGGYCYGFISLSDDEVNAITGPPYVAIQFANSSFDTVTNTVGSKVLPNEEAISFV